MAWSHHLITNNIKTIDWGDREPLMYYTVCNHFYIDGHHQVDLLVRYESFTYRRLILHNSNERGSLLLTVVQ